MEIKRSFGFLILSVLLSSAVSAQLSYSDASFSGKSAIFNDSFDNNSNNWFLDNLWIKGEIANGCYGITCKNYQRATGLSYKQVQIDLARDYEIEAWLRVISGSGGLAFGINSKFDHYRIELSANNTLVILKNQPSKGENQKLYSGSVSNIIKPGAFNKITVRKLKDNFYIYFNENFIGSYNNIKPDGDQVGFNVGLSSSISVDNLSISYMTGETTPALAERNITKTEDPKPVQTITQENISAPRNQPVSQQKNEVTDVSVSGPPLISWVSPSGVTTSLSSYTARVRAKVRSGSDLTSVLFYINGVSKGEGEIKTSPDERGAFIVEKTISLNPGENNVYLVATNSTGTSKSDLRYFSNPPSKPPAITWGNPVNDNVIVMSDNISIEASINSPTELKSAKILVNGNVQEESSVFQQSGDNGTEYKWQRNVILKEGDNSIYVIATNVAGSTTSEKRTVKYELAVKERRIALVIGNANYGEKAPLKNPVNDANLMEATLKELGFEVIKRTNASLAQMRDAVREFSKRLVDFNVGLFYYAGHGIQMDGINYLIPTDAVLADPSDCKYEALAVDFVTEEFGKYPDNINVVILDACRDNPYKTWSRGGPAGFKVMNPTSGTIISFATAAGSTAIDGTGTNGLFTEELVKQMLVPQPIEGVFKKTRVEVKKRSKDLQVPMEWTNLNGEFYFKK